MSIVLTPYHLAERFAGVKETAGATSTPIVLAMLQLTDAGVRDDEIPWCSAFVNWIAWLLELPRSRSLAARSWMNVGTPVRLEDARVDDDVVILERGAGGHVGFFAGRDGDNVLILGGNQRDAVNVSGFPSARVLGVRRLGADTLLRTT